MKNTRNYIFSSSRLFGKMSNFETVAILGKGFARRLFCTITSVEGYEDEKFIWTQGFRTLRLVLKNIQRNDSTPRTLTLGNNDEKGNNRKQSSHSLCIQSFFPSFFFLWETLPVVHVHLWFSTRPLTSFFWLLNHMIYLKLTRVL